MDLERRFIQYCFSLAETDFQTRIVATILHLIFRYARFWSCVAFLLVHTATIVVAYLLGSGLDMVLSALLPILAEVYWMLYSYGTDRNIFIIYFLLVVLGIGVGCFFCKLKQYWFVKTYIP